MSVNFGTADLEMPYHAIPRVDRRLIMEPESYVDVMLPSTANIQSRLRLYDVNPRWIRAVDLSDYPYRLPDDIEGLDAPRTVFDEFELDEEIIIGREHNPDNLPILDKNVISRRHFSLAVSLGNRGVILAIKDLGSHNGTEIAMNETFHLHEADSFVTVAL